MMANEAMRLAKVNNPVFKPIARHFVSADLKLETWADIAPYADSLLQRDVPDLVSLQAWLADLNEVLSVLSEESEWRFIARSRDVKDMHARQRSEAYHADIGVSEAAFHDAWKKKLLDHPLHTEITEPGFALWLDSLKTARAIYCPASLPLQEQENKLKDTYRRLLAETNVVFENVSYTPATIQPILQGTSRTRREEAWHALEDRRLQDAAQIGEIYTQLVALRFQMAQQSGFDAYVPFRFQQLGRVDYHASDCLSFHEGVEKYIVPLADRLLQQRKKEMGLETLRPWDLGVDPQGRSALHVFNTPEELLEKMEQVLGATDPDFAEIFRALRAADHIDLIARPDTEAGGYMMGLHASRTPFVFSNVADTVQSVVKFGVHEIGHCAHQALTDSIAFYPYRRWIPMEIGEMAAIGMEMLTMPAWQHFFKTPEEALRARQEYFANMLFYFCQIACIDAFQFAVYQNPHMTAAQYDATWLDLHKRFTPKTIDWSGLEMQRAAGWQRTIHAFVAPFYYIEYGIAQLGALQLMRNHAQDPANTLQAYKRALSLAYTEPLPQLYAEAGVRFDFSSAQFAELIPFLEHSLGLSS